MFYFLDAYDSKEPADYGPEESGLNWLDLIRDRPPTGLSNCGQQAQAPTTNALDTSGDGKLTATEAVAQTRLAGNERAAGGKPGEPPAPIGKGDCRAASPPSPCRVTFNAGGKISHVDYSAPVSRDIE